MSESDGDRPPLPGDEIVRFLEGSDDPVSSTSEVAAAIECSHGETFQRLSELAEAGRVKRKDVDGGVSVWWISDDGDPESAPAAPLWQLVGGLDEEAAAEARARSQQWRDSVDEELQTGDS